MRVELGQRRARSWQCELQRPLDEESRRIEHPVDQALEREHDGPIAASTRARQAALTEREETSPRLHAGLDRRSMGERGAMVLRIMGYQASVARAHEIAWTEPVKRMLDDQLVAQAAGARSLARFGRARTRVRR